MATISMNPTDFLEIDQFSGEVCVLGTVIVHRTFPIL